MREFLNHYSEYEYAVKAGRRMVASLILTALTSFVFMSCVIAVTIVGIKVCTVLGILGW